MSSSYIIEGGETGRARLSVLAEAMAPFTGALLDRAEPWQGLRVLDAGCGGGDVSRTLAGRVGPSGAVLGIDGDAVKIAAARDAAAGLANLAFEVGDLTDPDGAAAFDVVYARFLLSHLTEPDRVLASLGDRIRPGGRLIVEDVDFDGHFTDPPQPAFDRYVDWYQETARRRGANPRLGRELPRRIAAAGFQILHAGAVNPAALDGPIKQIAPLTLAAIAEPVVAAGLASRGAVEQTLAELQAAADDPGVFMSLPRVVQVVARRG